MSRALAPDGWIIVTTTVLIACTGLCWSAWHWPNLTGQTWTARLKQITMLLSSAIMVLILSFSLANSQQHWYRTWNDIAHSINPPTHAEPADPPRGAKPTQATNQQLPFPFTKTTKTRQTPITRQNLTPDNYGGHTTITIPGPKSGHNGKVEIWFPPGYFDSNTPAEHPVLYAFVGYPSVLDSYRKAADLGKTLTQLKNNKKLKAPIVIVPYWAAGGTDTECTDSTNGSIKIETWLTQDIPQWLINNTTAARNRNAWATLGFSAGGFCALSTTLRHPQTFSAAINYIGYANAHYESKDPKGDSWDRTGRYDMVKTLSTQRPPVAIWAYTTSSEELGGARIRDLRDAVQSPTSLTLVDTNVGGHTFDTWKPYIVPSLEWLGRSSAGFQADRLESR